MIKLKKILSLIVIFMLIFSSVILATNQDGSMPIEGTTNDEIVLYDVQDS